MKKSIFILLLTAILFFFVACNHMPYEDNSGSLNLRSNFEIFDSLSNVTNKKAQVVLLYGQSNATGVSSNDCLKTNDISTYNLFSNGFDNVLINYNCENFNNCSNGFVPTKLGQAASSNHFGPEVGIANIMNDTYSTKTFIIKYSYGGTELTTKWLNGNLGKGGLYNASIEYTKKSLDYILSKGYEIDILGICWMQGESDAVNKYEGYYDSTKALVSYYREDLKEYDESIKFVDAYIEDIKEWKDYKEINSAKLKYSNESDLNYLIDTIALGYSTANEPFGSVDRAHYDSMSMVDLGKQFAYCLIDNK